MTHKSAEISKASSPNPSGVVLAAIAFLLWGILPLYWKILKSVPAFEILMHRIVWSFVFMALVVTKKQQWKELWSVISQKKKIGPIVAGAILVSLNWGTYIWAVNADHVVDTSLGYYINPLLSVGLGVLVLREQLSKTQKVALALAFLGVLIITLQYHTVPWIALALATTFGLYGLVKKMANIDAVIGLTLETAVMLPLALGTLIYFETSGTGAFGHSSAFINLALAGAGLMTALPLLWFGRATLLVPLSTIGFIQYLTPTMLLLIALFIYNEPFTPVHLGGFIFIWIALAVYSWPQAGKRQPKSGANL